MQEVATKLDLQKRISPADKPEFPASFTNSAMSAVLSAPMAMHTIPTISDELEPVGLDGLLTAIVSRESSICSSCAGLSTSS